MLSSDSGAGLPALSAKWGGVLFNLLDRFGLCRGLWTVSFRQELCVGAQYAEYKARARMVAFLMFRDYEGSLRVENRRAFVFWLDIAALLHMATFGRKAYDLGTEDWMMFFRKQVVEVPAAPAYPTGLPDAPLHVVRAGDRQPMTLEQCERDQIEWTLQHAADNRTVAAKLPGIDRASLWRKMKRHGL